MILSRLLEISDKKTREIFSGQYRNNKRARYEMGDKETGNI